MRIVRDNTINFCIYRIEVLELRTMQSLQSPNPILSFQLCVVSSFAQFYFRPKSIAKSLFYQPTSRKGSIARLMRIYVRCVFMLKEISIFLLPRKENSAVISIGQTDRVARILQFIRIIRIFTLLLFVQLFHFSITIAKINFL